MNWELSRRTDLYNFWTLQDEQPLAKLKYGVDAQSLRLTYSRQRLFFLEPGGLFHNKVLIKNEYGLTIGEHHISHKDYQSGSLYVQEAKFHYHKENDTLIIVNKQNQILADCTITILNELGDNEFTALLFGLTWFCIDDLQFSKKEQDVATF
ncbi:MAG: hypothetical protein ICV84_10835 [Flavisolibacter sp.]|nr:hypothetical protein [Flavisolibacter sp.]MBD0295672.1 hypothetical protein [Flavisolibacter sp.]